METELSPLAYPCRVGIFDYLGSSRKSGVVFGLVLLRHYSVSCIELSHFPSCSQILPVITIFAPFQVVRFVIKLHPLQCDGLHIHLESLVLRHYHHDSR